MFKIIKKETEWCGQKISLETGKMARQADGAVVVRSGDTEVLCTAVIGKKPREGLGFLPLTVVYREMTASAGKIPGGFFKREGRPSEFETLTSRLIDRPIRPLFPKGFNHEVQVICTLLSYDGENSADILAMIGASAALTISGAPFNGPVSCVRVGKVDGELVVDNQNRQESDLDLIIAGTKDSILMVESEANELGDKDMLEALEFGHKSMQPIFTLIADLDKEVGNEKWTFEAKEIDEDAVSYVKATVEKDLSDAYKIQEKKSRNLAISEIKESLLSEIDPEKYEESDIADAFKEIQGKIVRHNIVKNGKRIDGRDSKSVRQIETEVSVLPRTHGSALFTRGETQALVTTTLGSGDDEQMIDSLDGMRKEKFMLHYNFLPYCVGEAYMLRAPGRREIGHGKLAWRAIRPMLPSLEDFPYTIRTVSEITSCNGSSSMATVCGSSLAMMDAGVPLKNPVAGIAMGLIMDGKKFTILSDILGDEDSIGDMDFKVAGTKNGITALQMDIKIDGVNFDIMKQALQQAREGMLVILDAMNKSLSEARTSVSKHAPTITKITINKNKIGAVIGPGGKNIKEICEVTGAKVDINDDGVVSVAAANAEDSEKAIEMINSLVFEPEIGTEYQGKVTKILDFGAVVSFMGSKEGLLHISEISDKRIENIRDVLNENDEIKVRVIGMDDRKGKIKLSTKPQNSEKKDSGKENRSPSKDKPYKKAPESQEKKESAPKNIGTVAKDKKPEEKNSENKSKKKYFNF